MPFWIHESLMSSRPTALNPAITDKQKEVRS